MGKITEIFRMYDDVLPVPDKHTKNWFLVDESPENVVYLTIGYLLFVWLMPKVMKNREPFSLKGVMVVYNLALVVFSAYMGIELILGAREAGLGLVCSNYSPEDTDNKGSRLATVLWLYFVSKAIEFLDTILMILRKKNNQVSFLHVFHHASMLNISWIVVYYIPGGHSYWGSMLNSFVHAVMYAYYGLAVIPEIRAYLWWKRYITRMQLIQFCMVFINSSVAVYLGCDYPAWANLFFCFYMIIMASLFLNFYYHAYQARKAAKPSTTTNKHTNGVTKNGNSPHLKAH